MSKFQFREIPFSTPAWEEEIALRYRILRAPLGISFDPEDLAKEGADHHLGLYDGDTLVACLVFSPQPDGTLKMRQVAVDENYQGMGVGTQLVKRSEAWALEKGFTRLVLHARETAVPFYLKMNYQKGSRPFVEVGIPHFKMHKDLR